MIIIRMSGGLGNQMFQYALYVKLLSLKREVCFDDQTQYDEETFRNSKQKRRPRMLGVFGIEYPTAKKEDLIRLTDASMDGESRIRRKLKGRHSLEKDDQDFIFDPSFLSVEEGYFCGNFQSPRYFEGVEEKVRQAFTFPEDLLTTMSSSEKETMQNDGAKKDHLSQEEKNTRRYEVKIRKKAIEIQKKIEEANARFDKKNGENKGDKTFLGGSTSVHLRFGDYLDKQDRYGGICTEAYYDKAVQILLKKDPEMTFFVFSNDSQKAGEWIRHEIQNCGNFGRKCFVLASEGNEDYGYLDLYLMEQCRNHIMANSSFSWWGAYLCSNPGKMVFAPSVWNHEPDGSELGRMDIYTPDMIRINPHGEQVTEKPLVSVIVTAYNVGSHVGEALSSVEHQTYSHLQIIAVDDGSEDETGKMIDAHAKKDSRICAIHTKNQGVAAARNEGLKVAKGSYIGFVDGDDRAHPEMIETMVQGVLSSGADMCTVSYQEIQDEGAFRQKKDAGKENPLPERETAKTDKIGLTLRKSVLWNQREAIRAYIHSGREGTDGKIVFHSAVWSKLFSQRILEGCQFPEATSAEDIPFTTKALCRSRKVLYIPKALYDYQKSRMDSIMNFKRADRTLRDEIPAWESHLSMLLDAGEKDLAEESEYYLYRRLLSYEEEYRKKKETKEQAKELQNWILAKSDRIHELVKTGKYGSKGDQARLSFYVDSPRMYALLSCLYEKIIVAWKNRK